MEERPGESKRDESNTNGTISRAADIAAKSSGKADGAACQESGKTRSGEEHQAGAASRESSCAAAGTGALQAV